MFASFLASAWSNSSNNNSNNGQVTSVCGGLLLEPASDRGASTATTSGFALGFSSMVVPFRPFARTKAKRTGAFAKDSVV
jgi:hypothetical protein